ncbi:MAG TPA: NUDIX hydrolase [Candidatus Saccharimonadia bacterium]|nr:NUDIX hydrolase [Candidatus Saccharimonadia bacterium]
MKAVIVNDENKVLILREAATYGDGTQRGRYHLPGGRVEVGEPFEDALHREVMEETGLQADIQYPLYVGEWHPVIKGVENQIIAVFHVCKAKTTDVTLSTEHDDYKWISLDERKDYDVMDPEDKVLDRYAEWSKTRG